MRARARACVRVHVRAPYHLAAAEGAARAAMHARDRMAQRRLGLAAVLTQHRRCTNEYTLHAYTLVGCYAQYRAAMQVRRAQQESAPCAPPGAAAAQRMRLCHSMLNRGTSSLQAAHASATNRHARWCACHARAGWDDRTHACAQSRACTAAASAAGVGAPSRSPHASHTPAGPAART
jgi:hypothetical protein